MDYNYTAMQGAMVLIYTYLGVLVHGTYMWIWNRVLSNAQFYTHFMLYPFTLPLELMQTIKAIAKLLSVVFIVSFVTIIWLAYIGP